MKKVTKKSKVKSVSPKEKSKVESVSVDLELTLSKYSWGRHSSDPNDPGEASFRESFTPLHRMVQMLFEAGVPLGSKVKITMKAIKG